VNGWQVIEDQNEPLSFGSQIEFKPSDNLSIDWNTYVGNERSASQPNDKGRFFSDLYFIYNPTNKLTLSLDVYGGRQRKDSFTNDKIVNWGQGNLNMRYMLNKTNAISARVEYYRDHHGIFIVPVTGVNGFDCYSATLSYCVSITDNVMLRLEGRYFQSSMNIFYKDGTTPVDNTTLLIGGLIAKF